MKIEYLAEILCVEVLFLFFSKKADALSPEDIVSSYAVHSEIECSFKCLQKGTCIGYNYRPKSTNYAENCQLSNKTHKEETSGNGEWTFYQDLEEVSNNI